MFGFLRSAERQRQTAIAVFQASVEQRVDDFLQQARNSGSPRGLVWKVVKAVGHPAFAVSDEDELLALIAIEVEFDAAEDGEMDDAPGLAMVRAATAVFRFRSDQWQPSTTACFNFWPDEVIAHQPDWTKLEA